MLISPNNIQSHNTYSSMFMNKKTYYVSDTSFNFYQELKKNDETDDNEKKNENNDTTCLISNLPLDKTSITLNCNHKFNYYYIFNEILNSKKNYNSMATKLNTNQIKCPYCRTIYNNVLPLSLDIDGTHRQLGVNLPCHYALKLNCIFDNCISTDVFVTPIGYYCKQHYKKLKMSNKKKSCSTENKAPNQPIKIKQTTAIKDDIHENWSSSIWNHYTIDKLKIFLKENNLKVSGKKALLISRLLNNNISPVPI